MRPVRTFMLIPLLPPLEFVTHNMGLLIDRIMREQGCDRVHARAVAKIIREKLLRSKI